MDIQIGNQYTSVRGSWVLDERIQSFVASDLLRTKQRLECGERITVETLTMDVAMEMIRDGRICDGKTIITLLQWNQKRRERVR